MSAVHALKSARAAGIRIGIDGDSLTLDADAAPPPRVLELLARHKAQVIALLRPGGDGWSADDWLAFLDERAGIVEFDGDSSRDQCEARALACCKAEWLTRNPVRPTPGRCVGCGKAEHGQDPLLPTGYAWLHSHCWPALHDSQKAEAGSALAAVEIGKTRPSP